MRIIVGDLKGLAAESAHMRGLREVDLVAAVAVLAAIAPARLAGIQRERLRRELDVKGPARQDRSDHRR